MNAIEVKNLSFSYDQKVLEDINLEVKEGDFTVIIGPNGGGKSTLLKLILGILKPQKGEIKVFGRDIEESLNLIGYVPQNTNINVDFPIKVYEVVLMGHIKEKKWGFGYSEIEKSCALHSLREVGMEEFAYKKIGDLSGGQRQRVMIARALCNHPKILLLDEPTANIDIDGQKMIYELLKKLNKDITIVTVSHDLSVILEYASKVAHINKKITFHDLDNRAKFRPEGEHFCEVEMLNMLGGSKC